MSGVMSITGRKKDEFVRVGTSIGDIVAGLFAVIGILTQLIYRNNTKIGSKLDLSMLDCQVAILENAIARYSIQKLIPEPQGSDHPTISPFGSFKTSDGEIIIAIGNDKLFKKFSNVLGDKQMATDELFRDNKNRNVNLKKLRKRMEEKLRKKSTDYWVRKLSIHGIPNSIINNIEDVVGNKQINSRNMILSYKYDSISNLKVSGNPLKFSFSKNKKLASRAPDLDENRLEILRYLKLV